MRLILCIYPDRTPPLHSSTSAWTTHAHDAILSNVFKYFATYVDWELGCGVDACPTSDRWQLHQAFRPCVTRWKASATHDASGEAIMFHTWSGTERPATFCLIYFTHNILKEDWTNGELLNFCLETSFETARMRLVPHSYERWCGKHRDVWVQINLRPHVTLAEVLESLIDHWWGWKRTSWGIRSFSIATWAELYVSFLDNTGCCAWLLN